MSEPRANKEVEDLLASLDAEFGKKVKSKGRSDREVVRSLNAQFHEQNPQYTSSPRGQLEKMKFESYYDWEMHRQELLRGTLEFAQQAGVPELQWLPEARVTFIINQLCGCCKSTVQFVGNEYIRFRGRRRKYRTLDGVEKETYPTMLRRVGEVDANLVAFGLPSGDPLPDFVDELDETVPRCPGCIQVERQALDIWIRATQPDPQGELNIEFEEGKV